MKALSIAKSNLIGLPDKAISDLNKHFIGIFFVFFKEKYASDEILRELINFDLLTKDLALTSTINEKIDVLINKHINIESELQKINYSLENTTNIEIAEIHSMLVGLKTTLNSLLDSYNNRNNRLVLETSYLNAIYNKYKSLEYPTFFITKKQIKLKDIYIPLELINRIAVTIDSKGNEIKIPISEIDNYNNSNNNQLPFIIEKMSVFDVFSKKKSVFIIGENGSGKTVAAKHLVCCLSGCNSSDSNYWNKEKAKIGITDDEIIPIYISLIDYYNFGKFGDGAENILNFLQKQFSLQDELIPFLKNKLSRGKAYIIIDDCNIKDIQSKEVIRDMISLMDNYSSNRFIIFRNNESDEIFNQYTNFAEIEKYELARLSHKKMREIAEKYILKTSLTDENGSFSVNVFLNNINDLGLLTLAEKPYWYVLLLLMQTNLGNIPFNTFGMHEIIIEDLLMRLLHRVDSFNEDDKEKLLYCFEKISLKLFESDENKSCMQIAEALEIFNEYFLLEKSSEMINTIKGNVCELFIYNNSKKQLMYTHKSLISTLVAKYFKHNIDLLSNLVDKVFNNVEIWLEALSLIFNNECFDLLSFTLFMIENKSNNPVLKAKIGLYLLSKIDVLSFITRNERKKLVDIFYNYGNELIVKGCLDLSDRILISQALSIISLRDSFCPTFDAYFCKIEAGKVVLGNDNLTHSAPYDYNIDYDYYKNAKRKRGIPRLHR